MYYYHAFNFIHQLRPLLGGYGISVGFQSARLADVCSLGRSPACVLPDRGAEDSTQHNISA